ncbi:MAG: hypothetical protein LBK59_03045, partial [Bifidobacteriaceae bacterium]|nr:hypothetical protein [Bifidobacteriaceae bacterium]
MPPCLKGTVWRVGVGLLVVAALGGPAWTAAAALPTASVSRISAATAAPGTSSHLASISASDDAPVVVIGVAGVTWQDAVDGHLVATSALLQERGAALANIASQT